jgi:hypothetical protein
MCADTTEPIESGFGDAVRSSRGRHGCVPGNRPRRAGPCGSTGRTRGRLITSIIGSDAAGVTTEACRAAPVGRGARTAVSDDSAWPLLGVLCSVRHAGKTAAPVTGERGLPVSRTVRR